ncbi:hypothetical protein, partial [uncultured Bilophila sp.]|uniref:hypothetical protein n=2 Tax=uncultured Bilophila sp. TaxID=529385 RepID=UPI00263830E3
MDAPPAKRRFFPESGKGKAADSGAAHRLSPFSCRPTRWKSGLAADDWSRAKPQLFRRGKAAPFRPARWGRPLLSTANETTGERIRLFFCEGRSIMDQKERKRIEVVGGIVWRG